MEAERLSRREAEIATAYAGGATYRQIAERLGIAPTTVRAHIYAVYRKLGVGSKIALSQALGGGDAEDVSNDRGAAPRVAKAVRPSVAILPFENRSGAPEHEGIIAGLVDRTTGTLSNFRMLLVIAAASSLTYRGSAKDITTIGEELGARYLLRGTFFRDGARLRVTAELVDAPTRAHVWSKTYDGAWSDIFELQDDLACSIAQAIEPEIRVREFERASRGRESNISAWELYCNGFDAAYRFTEGGYRLARDCALQAIEADETFAAPHALLSRIDFMETILAISPDPRKAIPDGIAHARRALDLEPRDEVAHCTLSCCLVMAGAFDEAFAVMDRAFEINSNSAEVHNARAFANVLAPRGDLRQVIADSEIASRMSPNDPMRWTFLANIGMAHLADAEHGSAEAALKAFREASLLPRASWFANAGAVMAALALGDPEVVKVQVARVKAARPGVTIEDFMQAFAHLIARSPKVRALIEELEFSFELG
ncbi:LuxR C-terminal-related transcriptional regulator [Alexandriicola marinus]|uniref:LuxR C-terminal-related transcriptional regulator n=1 Tax=Alexandriicola marinus TaxID=2081710 RepID=UPI000FDBDD95|nr:LuxR C-terminal-related transcriptional regulator [Alexandriicola marinus]